MSKALINEKYSGIVYTAAGATALAGVATQLPWETVNIIGTVTLTGVGYGIANDMFACRDCIEYFTIGHRFRGWDGKDLEARPLRTLDPNLNAIVWGAIATWHVTALAGCVVALFARCPFPGLAEKVSAAQLRIPLAVGASVILFVADRAAGRAKMQAKDNSNLVSGWSHLGVPAKYAGGWHACNTRNSTGYGALAIASVVAIGGILAQRAGLLGKVASMLPSVRVS